MSLRNSILDSTPASFFGKTTRQGDFVRIRIGSSAASFAQALVEDAHARRLDVGAPMLDEVVQFVLAVPGSTSIVVGASGPSHDSVGRAFAATIFAEVPSAQNLAPEVVPIAAQHFLADVVALVHAAPGLAPSELDHALSRLPPVLGALDTALPTCELAMEEQFVDELIHRCYEPPSPTQFAYALGTLSQASSMARGSDEGARDLVFACPIAIDADLFSWLAIVAAACPGRRLSYAWTEASPSLLATAGTPSGSLFALLGRTDSNAPILWPLSTKSERARADAHDRLPAELRAMISTRSSLGSLVECVSRNAR